MKKFFILGMLAVTMLSCKKKYCWQCYSTNTQTGTTTPAGERCKYTDEENAQYVKTANTNNTFTVGGGTYSNVTQCSIKH